MILTLGDSFTVKRFDDDKPWPEHLAQAMDLPLLNLSHEGESNSFMHRNLMWALEKYGGMISHVVIALTNWDRYELPYRKYNGMGTKTKTFKPKAIALHGQDSDPFSNVYLKYYNIKFHIDQAAHLLLSAQLLKEKHGFELVVIQPIVPFHWPTMDSMWQSREVAEYLDKESLMKYVDKDNIFGFELSGENVIFETNVLNDLMYQFSRKNAQNCMGFHTKMGNEFVTSWDGHPNQKGHKLIARKVMDWFDEISNRDL